MRRRRLRAAGWMAGLMAVVAPAAQAVVVRGVVRDTQGRVVPGARVQLIFGQRTASYAVTGNDGSFELRDGDSGRFVLLTAAYSFAPQIGEDFYGGQTDVVLRNVVLSPTEVRTAVSVTATGLATPVEQLTAPVGLISRDALATRVGVVDELRLMPGVTVVQQGQWGGVASLFVRGGGSDATKVLVDGVPATDIGGAFDFGTVSSTGLATPGAGDSVEVYRGANSAVAGTDALAGVLAMRTARGESLKPVLNYSGDGGMFSTYRNEAIVSGTHGRLDYLAGFSRFDTSNALPNDEFHATTLVGNAGFSLWANTPVRLTVRNGDSAGGLPDAYDFHHLAASGKQADQDIYGTGSIEHTAQTLAWHNAVRYGIARKREQAETFEPVGEPVTTTVDGFTSTTYYGLPTTIRGANGYFASGQAAFYPPAGQTVSDRDQLDYQSDLVVKHVAVVLGFRYTDERGRFAAYGDDERLERRNYGYSLGVQGAIKARLYYALAGAVEKNQLFGVKGTPRFGLAYDAIRPGNKPWRGLRLRANAATGVEEPSLAVEYASLYRQLLASGNTGAIAQYRVTAAKALRSRTLDLGLDQNILGQVLVLHAGVFHNQYSHQFDFVDAGTLTTLFGFSAATAGAVEAFGGAELNSLAYRAEGAEAELDFQPAQRLLVRAGYTYLATRVEQSFASDAVAAADGMPIENPTLPGIAIGATSPLVGGRVFRRPPQSAFLRASYTGVKWGLVLSGAAASRADDSTFLSYADRNGGNSLLLPNRDLDFAYVKADFALTYQVQPRTTVFAQTENLLNDQHIGPIGYPALPFSVRAGVKVRIGGY